MEIYQFFIDLFSDYTTRIIGAGTALLGIVSGILGVFATLKKQSLLGDAVAHSALPGIAIAFLITGTKDPLLFFIGAALSGWLATAWILSITKNTRIKNDTALGLVLSVFFGFGLVLLTFIQKLPNANQSGLETFLFGQAATLLFKDVVTMGAVGLMALVLVLIFWKEFKLLTFDRQFAETLGFNTRLLDVLLTTLIVLAIVLGLQTVGVVLMSAMLIAPAVAARQWTDKLGKMVLLAASFGAFSGLAGTAVSSSGSNISTGPTIILFSVLTVAVSFLFAPKRGVVARYFITRSNRRKLKLNKALSEMYDIYRNHENIHHRHATAILKALPGFGSHTLTVLQEKGLVDVDDQKQWCLTEKGINTAKHIQRSGGERS